MSSGYSCPCPFEWPLDTQGLKRDPVNCEKGWLDYAVRFLSRETVGKGKGQEAVWSEKCRPGWWDEKILGLKWKNPTANPKDTKDVLQRKYSALEAQLRADGRFPRELEEEAMLWKDGKLKELFLFTSCASFLGKTRGLHAAAEDLKLKADDAKAKVNVQMLNGIKQCLKSTLCAIENMCPDENVALKVPKKRKISETISEKENACFVPKFSKDDNFSRDKFNPANGRSKIILDPGQKEIIDLAKKITEKRKSCKPNSYRRIEPKTNISIPSIAIVPSGITNCHVTVNTFSGSVDDSNEINRSQAVSQNFVVGTPKEKVCSPITDNVSQSSLCSQVAGNVAIVFSSPSSSPPSIADILYENCEKPNEARCVGGEIPQSLDSSIDSACSYYPHSLYSTASGSPNSDSLVFRSSPNPDGPVSNSSPNPDSPIFVLDFLSSPGESPVFNNPPSEGSSSSSSGSNSSEWLFNSEHCQHSDQSVIISGWSDIQGPFNNNHGGAEAPGNVQARADSGYWSDEGPFSIMGSQGENNTLFKGETGQDLYVEDGTFDLEQYLFSGSY